MNIAKELADFAINLRYEDIPEDVVQNMKKSILDNFAIVLGAGAIGEGCEQMLQIAMTEGNHRQDAKVIGSDVRLSECWAAFANGSMSHSLDFGDAYERGTIHPTASTFATALSAAETRGDVSGKEFLTAMVAGCEVACRISYGITEDLAKYGWYMPPIITSFGATAAAGKLMGLNAEKLINAFSFNLCQTTCSSKILTNPDSVMRSIREAFAAKNAIISCYMADRNLYGFADPFGGSKGFYEAYARESTDIERAVKDIGKVFETSELSYKIWPCCRGTHAPIYGCLRLKEKYDINPEDIVSIHMKLDSMNEMLFVPREEKCAPQNMISGKFSIPFTVAAALLYSDVNLATFSRQYFNDEKIKSLANKLTYEIFPERAPIKAVITMKTVKGEYSLTETNPPGGKNNPVSFEQIAQKFKACASMSKKTFNDETIERVISMIAQIETVGNIKDISEEL